MVRALFPGITNDAVPGLSAAKVSNAERRRLKVCRFSSVSISLGAGTRKRKAEDTLEAEKERRSRRRARQSVG